MEFFPLFQIAPQSTSRQLAHRFRSGSLRHAVHSGGPFFVPPDEFLLELRQWDFTRKPNGVAK
jgi:hypothetical protein